MKTLIGFLLMATSIHAPFEASCLAAGAPVDFDPVTNQAITLTADGIDVYPSKPTKDGENHYIHIARSPTDPSRYVFNYCRNGISLELAQKGAFPVYRDCYHVIGNANGYTSGEISAEIDLMLAQAKTQKHSEIMSSVGSSVASGVLVLVALNVVEAVTTGGLANIPTDAAAVVVITGEGVGDGVVADGAAAAAETAAKKLGAAALKKIGAAALKKVALKVGIDGGKLILSTVLGTVIGQVVTNKISKNGRDINDNPFSSPNEMTYAANQVGGLLEGKPVVIIQDNMESFEAGLSVILGKIQ